MRVCLRSLAVGLVVAIALLPQSASSALFTFEGTCSFCQLLNPPREPFAIGTPIGATLGVNPTSDLSPGSRLTGNDIYLFEIYEPFPGNGRFGIFGLQGGSNLFSFAGILNASATGFLNNTVFISSNVPLLQQFTVVTGPTGNWDAFNPEVFQGRGSGAFWQRVEDIPEPEALRMVIVGLIVLTSVTLRVRCNGLVEPTKRAIIVGNSPPSGKCVCSRHSSTRSRTSRRGLTS